MTKIKKERFSSLNRKENKYSINTTINFTKEQQDYIDQLEIYCYNTIFDYLNNINLYDKDEITCLNSAFGLFTYSCIICCNNNNKSKHITSSSISSPHSCTTHLNRAIEVLRNVLSEDSPSLFGYLGSLYPCLFPFSLFERREEMWNYIRKNKLVYIAFYLLFPSTYFSLIESTYSKELVQELKQFIEYLQIETKERNSVISSLYEEWSFVKEKIKIEDSQEEENNLYLWNKFYSLLTPEEVLEVNQIIRISSHNSPVCVSELDKEQEEEEENSSIFSNSTSSSTDLSFLEWNNKINYHSRTIEIITKEYFISTFKDKWAPLVQNTLVEIKKQQILIYNKLLELQLIYGFGNHHYSNFYFSLSTSYCDSLHFQNVHKEWLSSPPPLFPSFI